MKPYLILIFTIFLITSCARVGSPTGGPKDTLPPKVLKSSPQNKAVNFKGKEIKILFDEFIQLKDLNKNLLITPPQKKQPEITPLGTASKEIRIKFKDSLLPNTTYVINFGESIVDFNEGNKLGNYQFIFSTGNRIDSLSLKGKVTPLYFKKNPEKIIIGLYPSEKFTDSIIFKEPPYYVTRADKNGNFNFNHLKKGTYKIIAINDEVQNYIYNPGKEAIGFIDSLIHIPQDSIVKINLFKEKEKFMLDKLEQLSHNHLQATYNVIHDSLHFDFLSPVTDSLVIMRPEKTDLWYKSKTDTIKLKLQAGKYQKEIKAKRKEKKDSLLVSIEVQANFQVLDSLKIDANIPIEKVNEKKIILLKDSLPVSYKLGQLPGRKIHLDFDQQTGKAYELILYPGAIKDFLGHENRDTIKRNFAIPPADKYGKLVLDIPNPTQNYFVELLDENKKIVRKSRTGKNSNLKFDFLKPGKYYVRIIYDPNKNNKWDTGNYLKHIAPESIIEISTPIEIRANWDIHQKIEL